MIIQVNYLKINFIRNVNNNIAVLCTSDRLIKMHFYKYFAALPLRLRSINFIAPLNF